MKLNPCKIWWVDKEELNLSRHFSFEDRKFWTQSKITKYYYCPIIHFNILNNDDEGDGEVEYDDVEELCPASHQETCLVTSSR